MPDTLNREDDWKTIDDALEAWEAFLPDDPSSQWTREIVVRLLATIDRDRAHIDTLTAAATKTRDRLAWWMWSDDDSGDSNDLVAAYDELRSILGPSTEEGVAATLAEEPHDA